MRADIAELRSLGCAAEKQAQLAKDAVDTARDQLSPANDSVKIAADQLAAASASMRWRGLGRPTCAAKPD
jgi:hypothetical protein